MKFYPVELILFGSHKEGIAEEESDIDIFQRAELLNKSEIETIKRYVVPIDVIALTPEELGEEGSLIGQLLKTGEVI